MEAQETTKFSLEELKAAHAKVKTGADFPKYIQDIKKLGLVTYEYNVKDGSTIYYGKNGYEVNGGSRYPPLAINITPHAVSVKKIIAIHQQGKTDFLTFCAKVAQAGVDKWIIDTQHMVCKYVDLNGDLIVSEPIPDGDYQ